MPPSSNPAARQRLAPRRPRSILLCRYGGPRFGGRLASQVLRRPGRINQQIVRDLDQLPAAPKGAVSCPNDNGESVLVIIRYRRQPDVVVSADLSGCQNASNGSLVRTASGYGTPSNRQGDILGLLQQIIPYPRYSTHG